MNTGGVCAYVLSESVACMNRVCAERMHAVSGSPLPFRLPETKLKTAWV